MWQVFQQVTIRLIAQRLLPLDDEERAIKSALKRMKSIGADSAADALANALRSEQAPRDSRDVWSGDVNMGGWASHKLIAEKTFTSGEKKLTKMEKPPNPLHGKKYHLFVSEHNVGAIELIDEVRAAFGEKSLRSMMHAESKGDIIDEPSEIGNISQPSERARSKRRASFVDLQESSEGKLTRSATRFPREQSNSRVEGAPGSSGRAPNLGDIRKQRSCMHDGFDNEGDSSRPTRRLRRAKKPSVTVESKRDLVAGFVKQPADASPVGRRLALKKKKAGTRDPSPETVSDQRANADQLTLDPNVRSAMGEQEGGQRMASRIARDISRGARGRSLFTASVKDVLLRHKSALSVTDHAKKMLQCESMLVYLTDRTWDNGQDSKDLGRQVAFALSHGIPLLLVHEMPDIAGDDGRHGVEFARFFHPEQTPRSLINAGIYHTVAVPLKGGNYRAVSMSLLVQKIAERSRAPPKKPRDLRVVINALHDTLSRIDRETDDYYARHVTRDGLKKAPLPASACPAPAAWAGSSLPPALNVSRRGSAASTDPLAFSVSRRGSADATDPSARNVSRRDIADASDPLGRSLSRRDIADASDPLGRSLSRRDIAGGSDPLARSVSRRDIADASDPLGRSLSRRGSADATDPSARSVSRRDIADATDPMARNVSRRDIAAASDPLARARSARGGLSAAGAVPAPARLPAPASALPGMSCPSPARFPAPGRFPENSSSASSSGFADAANTWSRVVDFAGDLTSRFAGTSIPTRESQEPSASSPFPRQGRLPPAAAASPERESSQRKRVQWPPASPPPDDVPFASEPAQFMPLRRTGRSPASAVRDDRDQSDEDEPEPDFYLNA